MTPRVAILILMAILVYFTVGAYVKGSFGYFLDEPISFWSDKILVWGWPVTMPVMLLVSFVTSIAERIMKVRGAINRIGLRRSGNKIKLEYKNYQEYREATMFK